MSNAISPWPATSSGGCGSCGVNSPTAPSPADELHGPDEVVHGHIGVLVILRIVGLVADGLTALFGPLAVRQVKDCLHR